MNWRSITSRLRRLQGDEGSGSLEFALSASILLMVLMGVMETSLSLYAYHEISEAAREGTRYAIVHGSGCSLSGSSCAVTSAQIQTYLQNRGYPGINAANMTVTASWAAYPSGTTCTPSASCNNPGNMVTVNVSYPSPIVIPFYGVSKSLTLVSQSSMIIAN